MPGGGRLSGWKVGGLYRVETEFFDVLRIRFIFVFNEGFSVFQSIQGCDSRVCIDDDVFSGWA